MHGPLRPQVTSSWGTSAIELTTRVGWMPDSRRRSSRYLPVRTRIACEPGAECSADVGLDVVADHRRRAGIDTDGGEHLLEEPFGGFADHVRVAAGGELDRGDERADVEREPVGAHPVAVLLQRDQLGAVHHLAEGVVEDVVAERGSEVPDDYRVGATGGLLELFEVAFDFLVHDQRDARGSRARGSA